MTGKFICINSKDIENHDVKNIVQFIPASDHYMYARVIVELNGFVDVDKEAEFKLDRSDFETIMDAISDAYLTGEYIRRIRTKLERYIVEED